MFVRCVKSFGVGANADADTDTGGKGIARVGRLDHAEVDGEVGGAQDVHTSDVEGAVDETQTRAQPVEDLALQLERGGVNEGLCMVRGVRVGVGNCGVGGYLLGVRNGREEGVDDGEQDGGWDGGGVEPGPGSKVGSSGGGGGGGGGGRGGGR